LETDLNHELHVPNIYIVNGESDPGCQY
jgi:hypothetical protein